MFEGNILLNSYLSNPTILTIQCARTRQSKNGFSPNEGFAMIDHAGFYQNFYCVFFDWIYILVY
jgi:hypothetical protein